MVVVPGATPKMLTGEDGPILMVATEVLLLDHVPPPASDREPTEPAHREEEPSIAEGAGFTVTALVIEHPLAVRVNVMLAVPAATPPTTPVDEPTVATDVLPLSQVPAPETSLRVIVSPGHTEPVPDIADGSAFTVSTLVMVQPEEVSVNVMALVPADTPVRSPVPELMVATVVLPLTQVPAPSGSDKVTTEPIHTVAGPAMAEIALTVTVLVADILPQLKAAV
jgi:hypothetical protein